MPVELGEHDTTTIAVTMLTLDRDIERHLKEAWLSLPSFVREATTSNLPPSERHIPETIQMVHQYIGFLLHRAKLRKALTDTTDLIRVSQILLARSLDILQNVLGTPFAVDIPWIVSLN